MTASRRTTIFIDGSAFRDTLRKAYYDKFRRLEESIDYHAFGQFLCAADEQLVRVNYYTGEPVEITEATDDVTGKPKPMMGRIDLGDHEAHRAPQMPRHLSRFRAPESRFFPAPRGVSICGFAFSRFVLRISHAPTASPRPQPHHHQQCYMSCESGLEQDQAGCRIRLVAHRAERRSA
jgi:hypothetical protein